MIKLPKNCPRKRTDCQPLAQILESKKHKKSKKKGFICCGLNTPESRTEAQDIFRHCWKTHNVDEIGDWDHRDMLSTIAVMSMALTVEANMQNNRKE